MEKASLPYRIDISRFEFESPGASPSSTAQYQYLLEDIDEEWSTWDETTYKVILDTIIISFDGRHGSKAVICFDGE